jgi:hypothetical protein
VLFDAFSIRDINSDVQILPAMEKSEKPMHFILGKIAAFGIFCLTIFGRPWHLISDRT